MKRETVYLQEIRVQTQKMPTESSKYSHHATRSLFSERLQCHYIIICILHWELGIDIGGDTMQFFGQQTLLILKLSWKRTIKRVHVCHRMSTCYSLILVYCEVLSFLQHCLQDLCLRHARQPDNSYSAFICKKYSK